MWLYVNLSYESDWGSESFEQSKCICLVYGVFYLTVSITLLEETWKWRTKQGCGVPKPPYRAFYTGVWNSVYVFYCMIERNRSYLCQWCHFNCFKSFIAVSLTRVVLLLYDFQPEESSATRTGRTRDPCASVSTLNRSVQNLYMYLVITSSSVGKRSSTTFYKRATKFPFFWMKKCCVITTTCDMYINMLVGLYF